MQDSTISYITILFTLVAISVCGHFHGLDFSVELGLDGLLSVQAHDNHVLVENVTYCLKYCFMNLPRLRRAYLERMRQLDNVVHPKGYVLVVLFVVLFQVAESAVQQRGKQKTVGASELSS